MIKVIVKTTNISETIKLLGIPVYKYKIEADGFLAVFSLLDLMKSWKTLQGTGFKVQTEDNKEVSIEMCPDRTGRERLVQCQSFGLLRNYIFMIDPEIPRSFRVPPFLDTQDPKTLRECKWDHREDALDFIHQLYD